MRFAPDFEPSDPSDPDGGDPGSEGSLDEDFPLGDGTADLDASAACPYCGESVTLALDPGSGEHQEYVEDCPVCCQPWQVRVIYGTDGRAQVTVDEL